MAREPAATVNAILELPMFPLGTVLVPGQHLPLHVFEERYRVMIRECLAADHRFGVVLIERGHEVGGGDQRASTGTVAEIVEAAELADGRWLLHALGHRRLRVEAWLPDDPYPRARVQVVVDPAPGDPGAGAAHREQLDHRLRRLLALRRELGDAGPDIELADDLLADDLAAASYQATILSGVTAFDALRLLELDDPVERLGRLVELVDDQIVIARARLAD